MYTALVLNQTSSAKLKNKLANIIHPDWEIFCHHMTINMGSSENGPLKGSPFSVGDLQEITVVAYAFDAKVMAVKVTSKVPSINSIKHITIAVNVTEGGKPFMSNKLTNWTDMSPFTLSGTIEEVA
jgi:hypothetical protein